MKTKGFWYNLFALFAAFTMPPSQLRMFAIMEEFNNKDKCNGSNRCRCSSSVQKS